LFLFIFPLLPLNQLIVGTIVNAILIKSALSINSKKVFLLSLIPSSAVFFGGVLFANLTFQIALMLPFIWMGNFVLMFLIKKWIVENRGEYFVSTFVSSICKNFVLFSAAFVLVYFGLVPVIFLTMFGLMQFITAMSGAVLVYFFKEIKEWIL
jgi:hypothetical protein